MQFTRNQALGNDFLILKGHLLLPGATLVSGGASHLGGTGSATARFWTPISQPVLSGQPWHHAEPGQRLPRG